ncbi:hypothetical protein ACHAWX_000337 [Stephanocyclus meneghinianus]
MIRKSATAVASIILFASTSLCIAFTFPSRRLPTPRWTTLHAKNDGDDTLLTATKDVSTSSRRCFLLTALTATASASILPRASTADEPTDFESIAARAAAVSAQVAESEASALAEAESAEERRKELAARLKEDTRTIYDFVLPVNGKHTSIADLVGQTFELEANKGDGWTDDGRGGSVGTKVKAILVVNIKQDDPIARKNIPELIALATFSQRFGKNGEFAVIVSPTDQGYYEPDTSALIRLKLASEYGYGNSPGTILTDKVNLLGSGAVPFWRWLEGSCRTPAGLGKIQGNFEKFLVDGRTGKPLRRYPRKYQPYDIADDIAALIEGRPLPPAQANFKEEWRNAAKEAENDTYRFQKGLNYFDQ